MKLNNSVTDHQYNSIATNQQWRWAVLLPALACLSCGHPHWYWGLLLRWLTPKLHLAYTDSFMSENTIPTTYHLTSTPCLHTMPSLTTHWLPLDHHSTWLPTKFTTLRSVPTNITISAWNLTSIHSPSIIISPTSWSEVEQATLWTKAWNITR